MDKGKDKIRMEPKTDIRETHNELLKLMINIHDILMNNKVNYSLTGGSLIGAIRHNGFIPWDDDMDIMVDRANFEKMKRCFAGNENYSLIRGHRWAPWLYRISANEFEGKIIPMVDVFIMDNLPDGLLSRKIKILKLRFLQGMLKKEIRYKDFSFFYRICIFVTHILGLLFSQETKLKWYDRVSAKDNKHATKSVSLTNDSFGLLGKTYDNNVLSECILHPFESSAFLITKEYDQYLTGRYGDYLTPPEQIDRVPEHLERVKE